MNRIPINKKTVAVVAILAATVILVIVYSVADPGSSAWGRFFPKCPVKLLTGLDCPSCGIQRAVHAMLNGDFGAALRFNFFIPFSLLYLLGLLLTRCFCSEESKWRRWFWGLRGGLTYIAVYVVWFIVRNLLGI
ncbi:MAG: DUF2752 domain-containing protein [Muribaculaceae bacterium]|nr:DUF2752 domain-containing protein [Muribaculaceae bacterium]